jgi:Holliday junction resolvase RusA-like endonuclease
MDTHGKIEFFVAGTPKPAGSKRAFPLRRKDGSPVMKGGRIITTVVDSSGQPGKDWRGDVRAEAAQHWDGPPLGCRMHLETTFFFPRPKSHYGTGKNAEIVKDGSPAALDHIQKPDALKLQRAVEDALTGIIWIDDAQLSGGQHKEWADRHGGPMGALINITW